MAGTTVQYLKALRRHRIWSRRRTLPAALDQLARQWELPPPPSSGPGPVFLLAGGWRSGSTLLQRIVASSGQVLVWGEPYANAALLPRMAASFEPQTPYYDDFILDPAGGVIDERDLWASWTANLTPHPRHLVEAHRQFWRALYEVPARELGFGRWGVKEVRLGLDEAIYLRFLFPTARFVFLYRNPYAGYRSYRHWMPWYERWPDRPVLGASAYGRMWKRLVSGFVASPAAVDALVLRYEDLARDDGQIEALGCHLDLTLSGGARGVEVRGPQGTPPADDVPQLELMALRRAVEPLASQLGYSPPLTR